MHCLCFIFANLLEKMSSIDTNDMNTLSTLDKMRFRKLHEVFPIKVSLPGVEISNLKD